MSFFEGIVFLLLVFQAELSSADLRPTRDFGRLCNEEAMNPYPGECHKYVVCLRDGNGGFLGAVSECQDGEAFDKASRACVPASQIGCNRRPGRQVRDVSWPPGSTGPTTGPMPSPSDEPPKSCNGRAISCADCNSLRICSLTSTGFTFMKDVQCSDGNKITYCDPELSSCTEKIPGNCDSGYQCTGDGYFPDATDCTVYHLCYEGDGGKLQSQSEYCATGQVYSTSQKMCTARKTAADCHTVKCPVNKTLVTSFPGEPSYYVVCIVGKPEFVYYCGDYQEFNAAKGSCEVKCKQAGRIPDSSNCMGYYECSPNRVGGGFTAVAKTCPNNYKFDAALRNCVPGSCA